MRHHLVPRALDAGTIEVTNYNYTACEDEVALGSRLAIPSSYADAKQNSL